VRLTILFIVLLVLPISVAAATFEVTTDTDTNCPDGACDFQSALTAAAGNLEDDVINLPDTSGLDGGYLQTTVTFDYTAAESFDLVINGSESGWTWLDGGTAVQILSIQATGGSSSSPIEISVSNVTFLHGHSGGASAPGPPLSATTPSRTIPRSTARGSG